MSSIQRTIRVLAALLPLGAAGMSSALAATAKPPLPPGSDSESGVAARLQAVRSAVSKLGLEQTPDLQVDPNIHKAWWGNWGPRFWGNGGWRNGGWGNGGWRNWRNGWGNGGWNNWHNGGWPNFWRNW
ncbi:MAG: GrrA/OscA1 family cyclophane-containing rSAM-modified RiPP [Acetobacteraceae bacterium]|nr:rSAM-associated Gly-rich repeat protein [Pseudomonadota bacterium]